MNMLKLIFPFFFFLFSVYFNSAYAVCDPEATNAAVFLSDCAQESENAVGVNSDWGERSSGGKEEVKELVIKIAERVLQFGALFAIGAIVFAGMRYTSSAGDDEKIKSAKNTIMYAIIGLVLLLVAFPLVDIIIGFIYSLGT